MMSHLYMHLKSRKLYGVLFPEPALDATNATEGRKMIVYHDKEQLYTREEGEFRTKFTPFRFPEGSPRGEYRIGDTVPDCFVFQGV